MKIASFSIAMSSEHSLVQRDEQRESLRYWTGDRNSPRQQLTPLQQIVGQLRRDLVEISNEAKKMLREQARAVTKTEQQEPVMFELSDEDKQKIQLVQDFIEVLTGKRIRFVVPKQLNLQEVEPMPAGAAVSNGPVASTPRQGWGLAYDYHESHFEQEQTTFAAAGVVRTADGQEIDFSVAINMSRQFMSEQNISVRAGDALVDPLVINFDGPAASLSQTKFSFDLDSDGTTDNISFVNPGSGFLALDLNNDGKVNDGGELFGPQSGDGFADLAKYDSDGNNWIDENDAIYEKLRIWTKDANGNDYLFALGQKGVGAIYLGNVSTEFAMKDSDNALQGQLRSSGVFLREDGSVGTVQQIDLAV